jgi:hypothetical protein
LSAWNVNGDTHDLLGGAPPPQKETGDAPVVELAAANFEVAGEILLGHQVEFVARRGWVRVHARWCAVNLAGNLGVAAGKRHSWAHPKFP